MKISRVVTLSSVVLAACFLLLAGAASAHMVSQERFDQFLALRAKEKTLLPGVTLANPYSADALAIHQALKPFTGGNVGRAVESVDLSFQAGPFGNDHLTSPTVARALVQLGMLSHMGHFALLNAGDPTIKADALDIVNQLAEVADHFKLAYLRSEYQRIANEAGEMKYQGGPGPVITKYDTTVASLYDYVANSFGIDGHWYFTYGGAIAGLYVTSAGGDRLDPEYFLSVLDDLYHYRPSLTPDYQTRVTLRSLMFISLKATHRMQKISWNSVSHYILGTEAYLNPYEHGRYGHMRMK